MERMDDFVLRTGCDATQFELFCDRSADELGLWLDPPPMPRVKSWHILSFALASEFLPANVEFDEIGTGFKTVHISAF